MWLVIARLLGTLFPINHLNFPCCIQTTVYIFCDPSSFSAAFFEEVSDYIYNFYMWDSVLDPSIKHHPSNVLVSYHLISPQVLVTEVLLGLLVLYTIDTFSYYGNNIDYTNWRYLLLHNLMNFLIDSVDSLIRGPVVGRRSRPNHPYLHLSRSLVPLTESPSPPNLFRGGGQPY